MVDNFDSNIVSTVWKNSIIVIIATPEDRTWKVKMVCFGTTPIRLHHAKERWFACFIFMRTWTTARTAAGNVTNSNHELY